MTSLLALILAAKPEWMALDGLKVPLTGEATLRASGAARDWKIGLTIAETGGVVEAREQSVGVLPNFCPQRHVNENGSFCLGYRVGENICSVDDAAVWWGLLLQYLSLQRIASRTRRWPPRQALAHGDAGRHQLDAQEAAARIGILEQYLDMLDGAEHWLAGRHIVLNKAGDGLINGRLNCPVGCLRSRKPRLRRECCRKADVARLVRSERQRIDAERRYWYELRQRGLSCCGTMKVCPLRASA
jgi:hypothetical protein